MRPDLFNRALMTRTLAEELMITSFSSTFPRLGLHATTSNNSLKRDFTLNKRLSIPNLVSKISVSDFVL